MEIKNNVKAYKKISLFLTAIFSFSILYFIYYSLFLRNYIKTENSYIAGNQVTVTAQIQGIIKEISAEETQPIVSNSSIIKIDPIDYQIALNNSKANLANAVREYYSLQNNIVLKSEALKTAEANLNIAYKTLQREEISNKAGITSKEDFDLAAFKYTSSKNSYEQSLINLNNSKLQALSSNIYSHPKVIIAIQDLKKSFYDLKKTNISSPISGIIAQKQVEIGQQVSVGQPLVTVINLTKTWVTANFKETQLENIKLGNSVEIKSDLNGKFYKGLVTGIAPGSGSSLSLIPTQNATGNWIKVVQRVPVRIDFYENSLEENGLLPIGTSLNIKIDTSKIIDFDPLFSDQKLLIEDDHSEELDTLIKKIIEENSI
ncbi:MAG: HlyD family efflux transporter periplasmic adaptor subunit [Cetobacterium sp.]